MFISTCSACNFVCFFIVQTIHEELTTNQHLVSEVNLLAEPFEPEAGERAADVGVQWTELESSLDRLSNCYGHVAADWMGIEAELDDIQQWCLLKLEWTQHSVTPGEEDETLAQIQVCNFPFLFHVFFICLLSKKKNIFMWIYGENREKLFTRLLVKVNYY